ncbi:hypothetical protein TEQG_01228 [Trichophyton equinum CBS 127.97]|uniref:Uncharacterized protein n=1 Tax=Trichophyton equinum (strain ATCC MYA-4606 / CBS 127.97) TaxID=559882 RepID=F2PJX1_TRIEC|nr:hypothetical protein TEQG_01228 [Trichophyton equinum CBS 127.97]
MTSTDIYVFPPSPVKPVTTTQNDKGEDGDEFTDVSGTYTTFYRDLLELLLSRHGYHLGWSSEAPSRPQGGRSGISLVGSRYIRHSYITNECDCDGRRHHPPALRGGLSALGTGGSSCQTLHLPANKNKAASQGG